LSLDREDEASADVVRKTDGRVDTPRAGQRREELAGVEERGMYAWGFPRNLGDLLVCASMNREGYPMKQPRPGDRALAAPRREDRARARYRCAKATKRGGTDEQESEYPVVPVKRGNAPERTPGREGDAGSWTRWGDR